MPGAFPQRLPRSAHQCCVSVQRAGHRRGLRNLRALRARCPEGYRRTGAVAVFDESGNLPQTIIGGELAARPGDRSCPAVLARSATTCWSAIFGFVASEINAFDPMTRAFQGDPKVTRRRQYSGERWSLFGIGGMNGDPQHTLLHRWHRRRDASQAVRRANSSRNPLASLYWGCRSLCLAFAVSGRVGTHKGTGGRGPLAPLAGR